MIFGKHINRYYFKYAFWLLMGLAALIAVDYAQLMVPALYRLVVNGMKTGLAEVDGVQYAFDMNFLLDNICLPLIIIIVMMVFGRFLWRICLFGAAIKVETDVRNSMFDHAKDLSRQYYQVHKVGDMMSLFTNDLETIHECFASGILMFFDALFLGALSVIKMWRMNPVMTVLSMIPMLLLLAVSSIIGSYMMRKWEIRQQAFSGLSDFSQESFSGIAVIKAFVKEGKELWAFKKLNEENEHANIVFTRASVLLRILVMLFVESVVCVILGYGGYLVYNGVFDAGQLVEFIGYFTSIVWPIMAVSELIDLSSRGKASLKRVSELLDAPIDVINKKDAVDIGAVKGDIEFRNLSFRYPDGEFDALHNVSFKINAGENVGIVGKTGSGKTTIVDLILRTYNVEDGCLFVDGKDVNSVTIRSLREGCAYVPQDNFLFSDTISANIAFGMDEYDTDAVTEAAKLSDVHGNIIEFSEGYSTVLGERGVTVSGGQKQRISIARALLRNAPILILDDSVSAVDTKTEKAILENLSSTRKGMTTLLIAHRISTIEKMDKILFVEDGTVAAVGTHTHLYETNSEYRKMVDLQKLEEEGANNNA